MIYTQEMFGATCDNCGESWEDSHAGWSFLNDKGALLEGLQNSDWYTGDTDPEHDGKLYCPSCFKYHEDIDEKIIVDESRKKPIK